LWLHSLKVAQLLRSAACLHTNQSRSYLNHLVVQFFFQIPSYVDCLLARSPLKFQHDTYLLWCIQCWDSWWWIVDLSETCRVLYQNKVEKKCILLAFIIRIYHDARSSECQILAYYWFVLLLFTDTRLQHTKIELTTTFLNKLRE